MVDNIAIHVPFSCWFMFRPTLYFATVNQSSHFRIPKCTQLIAHDTYTYLVMKPTEPRSSTAANAFKPINEAAEAADALSSDDEGDEVGKTPDEGGGGAGDSADGGDHPVEEIESLCMQCHENVS